MLLIEPCSCLASCCSNRMSSESELLISQKDSQTFKVVLHCTSTQTESKVNQMGKVRHRKRTRTARLEATATPLTGQDSTSTSTTSEPSSSTTKLAGPQKKEQEITNLLDKLRSNEARERVWATVSDSPYLSLLCLSFSLS